MVKQVVFGLVLFFVVMTATTFWIFSSFESDHAEDAARSEKDFITEHFVVTEIWEQQTKKGSRVISSYFYMKVKNEAINLRLPWQGLTEDQLSVIDKINAGDSIEVKVIRKQLADARQNGVLKGIYRFIMGDEREVSIFKLTLNQELLVDKDIHGWDEAKITLLKRLTDNPLVLVVPFALLVFIISYVKKKRAIRAAASK